MKIMISFLSTITVIMGVLHFFDGLALPTKGKGYAIMLGIFGLLIIAASFANGMLLGFEKFMLILEGTALLFIALLPFFQNFLAFLPREGVFYGGAVVVIGALGLLYGLLGMG